MHERMMCTSETNEPMITPFTIKPLERFWECDYWKERLTDEYISQLEGEDRAFIQRSKDRKDALLAREAWEQKHNLNPDGSAINAYWSDRLYQDHNEPITVPPEDPVSAAQIAYEAMLPQWEEGRYYRISWFNQLDRGLDAVRQFDSQEEWDTYLAQECNVEDKFCRFLQPVFLGETTVTGGFGVIYYESYPYSKYEVRVTLNSFEELKAYESNELDEDGGRDTETTFLWWEDESGKRERLIDYRTVLSRYDN